MTRCAFPVLVVLIGVVSVPPREEQIPPWNIPPLTEPTFGAVDAEVEMDVYHLAQLATGEDPKAAAAVTWVVLNRAGCRVAPLRCRVPLLREVTRPRAFGTHKGGRWLPAWRPDGPVSARVLAEVRNVVLGSVPDPTGRATHFHRLGTWTPPWAPHRKAWRVFGSHAFYRPIDAHGRISKWRN